MSARFGNCNKPAISVPRPAAIASNAALVGANTVKVAKGFVNAGSNSAVTTAVVKEVKPLSIATSTTVSNGTTTASNT